MSFRNYLQQKGHTKRSIQTYLYEAEQYEKWAAKEGLEVAHSTQNDVLAFLQHLQNEGKSQRTLQHYLGTLKKYFDYLQTTPNPCANIQIRGIRRTLPNNLLTAKELDLIFENYQTKTIHQQRNKAILSLFIYQGITSHEAMNLQVQNMDLPKKILQIPDTKNSAGRTLPLQEKQISVLQNYLQEVRPKFNPKNGLLFLTLGNKDRPEALQNTLYYLAKRLRKQHPFFENLQQIRASRIVLWMDEHNLRQVQYLAGHRYISSTERYQQCHIEDLQRSLEQFHPRK